MNRHSINFIAKAARNANLALEHFDGLYAKVYGRNWPSMRLGLLSPKKHCAVLNSFVDTHQLQTRLTDQFQAIDLQRYYRKHLVAYTRWLLRKQLIDNKRARKRDMVAKDLSVEPSSINLDSIEVSDISDSELKNYQTTDVSDGFSTAEDLQAMFSDRRLDDDEKYFINQASTHVSLEDFMPTTEFVHNEHVSEELSYYRDFNQDDEDRIEFRQQPPFEVDSQLKIYTLPVGTWHRFDQPALLPESNLLSHYMLDGASVLSVLALDIQPNDTCADYCAAPGGKSLIMLMSLKPKFLLSNDISSSRLSRTTRIINQYAPKIKYVKSVVHFTRQDATSLVYPETFDKIIVDAPCSNDRNSVGSIENNLFNRHRTEERLELPRKQCKILVSALKSLKPNGSVVYSTCTLSPIENDGVVQRAIIQMIEEGFPGRFAVMDLKEAFRPFRGLFRFNTKFKYGQQINPSICSNFGPMYISKIKRLA